MKPSKNSVLFLSLLFFLLYLPNHISSDLSDILCDDTIPANLTTVLQFKFLDKFGDDASALRDGGNLQLGCQYQSKSGLHRYSCKFWWAMFYKDGIKDEKLTWGHETVRKYADDTLVELSTILDERKDYHSVLTAVLNGEYSISCTCCKGREEKSVRLQLMGEICNPVDGKVCFPDGVCVQKVATNEQGCESRTLVNKTANAHFWGAYQAWYGNSIRGFHPAPEFDQFQRYLWPKMEVKIQLDDGTPRESHMSELENIWEQDLYFRQLIPIKQTPFLLKLRQENYEILCQAHQLVVCKLKTTPQPQEIQPKLKGNCSHGWSLSVKDIWDVENAKIYCKLSLQNYENALRWQFHVLPCVAIVKVDENGIKKCNWPIWTKKEPTELKGSECEKLQKTISYPPPQAGTVISFETMRSPNTEENETRSTSSVKTSEETISKVPKFVRIAPIVITVIAVVQLLPILLYTIYVKYKGWRNFQKIQRDERRRELAKIKRKKEEEDYKRWEEAQKKNYF